MYPITAFAGLCGLLILVWLTRRVSTARRALEICQAEQRDLRRLLRLTAGDLRAPAIGLLGHAAHVAPLLAGSLLGVCRDLLDIAEALQDQTEEPAMQRTLRVEDVPLGRLVEFVVAQVAGQLGPGRRAWRVDPALGEVVLRGDRRALHQVLLRLLGSAVLATGEGDGIAISGMRREAGWALVIEDEGTGLAVPHIDGMGLETRGLGVGLALVRSLLRAHGGSLTFESTALVGTRAVLEFPDGCVEMPATQLGSAPRFGVAGVLTGVPAGMPAGIKVD